MLLEERALPGSLQGFPLTGTGWTESSTGTQGRSQGLDGKRQGEARSGKPHRSPDAQGSLPVPLERGEPHPAKVVTGQPVPLEARALLFPNSRHLKPPKPLRPKTKGTWPTPTPVRQIPRLL